MRSLFLVLRLINKHLSNTRVSWCQDQNKTLQILRIRPSFQFALEEICFTCCCQCGILFLWAFSSYRYSRFFRERAVRARTLAGDFMLCSWARHLTLTVSQPRCMNGYRQINPAMDWHPSQGRV